MRIQNPLPKRMRIGKTLRLVLLNVVSRAVKSPEQAMIGNEAYVSPQSFWFFDRIKLLSLHTTRRKPFTHAFWPLGVPGGCNPNAVVNGFFVSRAAVLRTIASTCMGGAEGNTGAGTPPEYRLPACQRGTGQEGRTSGETTYHRMNRCLKGLLVLFWDG